MYVFCLDSLKQNTKIPLLHRSAEGVRGRSHACYSSPIMRMPPFPFVVLDTEATGLFPRIDKILELAIVRFEEGEKVAEYSSLYRVDREIPSHIQTLTHIRPADLEGKPLLSEEKAKIEEKSPSYGAFRFCK